MQAKIQKAFGITEGHICKLNRSPTKEYSHFCQCLGLSTFGACYGVPHLWLHAIPLLLLPQFGPNGCDTQAETPGGVFARPLGVGVGGGGGGCSLASLYG